MAQFTLYNKHSAPPSDSTRVDCDHVPLCSINDVQLRFLVPDDLTEVRQLCQEWFPIDYPLSWYEDITSSTRFFALAAVYNLAIIGLIVAEIKPYRNVNKEVIANMSDSDELYTRLSGFPMQDKGILPDSMGRTADVGYILSLGVHRSHRRNGIGSLLLDALMNHLTTAERHSIYAALFPALLLQYSGQGQGWFHLCELYKRRPPALDTIRSHQALRFQGAAHEQPVRVGGRSGSAGCTLVLP
ncbi:uncharacterized protein Dana_GF24673, isoform C [Drosophila ananassae]|uniref:N-alpha-acetyltransferase 60 n=1 Tax=Drosophila ananassae TaxID=7217 RepID=A0A0P9C2J4_DROAN|nr:N-alpha-acetyltransferase 60 isoform X3 [Drosophila ananassae]KPU77886.1 uncharacterized protein Dana_GF24673, isoform C [Drosophila ananassae]